MLFTKTGRRMFPNCVVTVTGLNPRAKYMLMMEMVESDDNKYKVVLHSMHKYQPRHSPLSGDYLRFTFPEAAFIAVTAYQNSERKGRTEL